MFENLSKREKVMAIVVASLLPIALLFLGVSSVAGKLEEKNSAISGLEKEKRQLERQHQLGKMAMSRRTAYRSESLPANNSESVLQYQHWLEGMARDVGASAIVRPMNAVSPDKVGKDPSDPVFSNYRYLLNCNCNLRQLTALLYRFNETRVMHRIKRLVVKPEVEGTGSRQTLTGNLVVTINVDVACLPGAAQEREFEKETRETPVRSLADYHDIVTRRNLFGPPNEAPEFDTDDEHTFEIDERIVIDLEADDENEDQQLQYELVDYAGSGAEIVQDDGSNDAELRLPRLELGTHQITLRVIDNGWPPKSDELDMDVIVEEPAADTIIEIRPEALDTYITADITFNGIRQVHIDIRPQEKVVRLAEGESFKLDDKTWTIVKIEDRYVTINCDGKTMKFKQGNSLAHPERDNIVTASDR